MLSSLKPLSPHCWCYFVISVFVNDPFERTEIGVCSLGVRKHSLIPLANRAQQTVQLVVLLDVENIMSNGDKFCFFPPRIPEGSHSNQTKKKKEKKTISICSVAQSTKMKRLGCRYCGHRLFVVLTSFQISYRLPALSVRVRWKARISQKIACLHTNVDVKPMLHCYFVVMDIVFHFSLKRNFWTCPRHDDIVVGVKQRGI